MLGRLVLPVLALAGTAAAQPANDACTAATLIPALPFRTVVDVSGATVDAGDPAFECDFDGPDQRSRTVWFRYTATAPISLIADTEGSDYDTELAAWVGGCAGPLSYVSCNDDDFDLAVEHTPSGYERSRMLVSLQAGDTLLIEATGEEPTTGPGNRLELTVREAPHLRVGDFTAYQNQRPAVAAGDDGTFLVAWNRDDEPRSVQVRHLDSDGKPLAPPVAVSVDDLQFTPVKADGGGGQFVVAWNNEGSLVARRIDATGTPVGPVIEVEADLFLEDWDVAVGPTGAFLVAYEDEDGDGAGIMARLFDATGTPMGVSFAVNTHTDGRQELPAVSDAGTGFIVTWSGEGADDEEGVFGRRIDAAGTPLGVDFLVNTTTDGGQFDPDVSGDADGDFVVSWTDAYGVSEVEECGRYCVIAQRFDVSAAKQGPELVVNTPGADEDSRNYYSRVSMTPAGDFTVVWSKHYPAPHARRFDADGSARGDAFQLPDVQDAYQYFMDVGGAPDGDFVVAWDWSPYGSNYQVIARHLGASEHVCSSHPQRGCRQPLEAFAGRLILKNDDNDQRDVVALKWVKGAETTLADFGDPLADHGYALCVYDATEVFPYGDASPLVLEEQIPAGGTCGTRPCWSSAGPGGFRYKDKSATPHGVQSLTLTPGLAGKTKLTLKAKGLAAAVPRLPLVPPVRAQLQAANGECWEALYAAGGVVKNTARDFVAKPTVP